MLRPSLTRTLHVTEPVARCATPMRCLVSNARSLTRFIHSPALALLLNLPPPSPSLRARREEGHHPDLHIEGWKNLRVKSLCVSIVGVHAYPCVCSAVVSCVPVGCTQLSLLSQLPNPQFYDQFSPPSTHIPCPSLQIVVYTHAIGGLSDNDFILAEGIDKLIKAA